MVVPSSRRSSFRTAEYWAAIEAIADDLINETMPSRDARGTLQRLSNRGFGPASLFDLCTLLALAAPRPPAEPTGPGDRAPAMEPPAEESPAALAAAPVAELKRGPVTVAAHPTAHQLQHLRELEASVAEALLISPEHPRVRDAVRRALMARGSTVHDATVVYGIVCELFTRDAL
ncbi:hypothetical protein [Streptomyces botrytidirepellens]|uniref:Uncharacterized protein n=1 Tax=Streptomyces botrytidirepellens TaxID=2486417 RepID=A0A3M8WKE9_9ACTN|nr:hypothetical protein [Streptomyces botrytidirepellens]RNG30446.1 hypothetical protein EEJ42_10470 [Streptomyces botrytidirepellens]